MHRMGENLNTHNVHLIGYHQCNPCHPRSIDVSYGSLFLCVADPGVVSFMRLVVNFLYPCKEGKILPGVKTSDNEK